MNFVQNRQRNTISMSNVESENGAKSNGESSELSENEMQKKSVEDLINGSHEVIGAGLTQALSFTSGSILQSSPIPLRRSPVPGSSPSSSPKPTNYLRPDSASGRDETCAAATFYLEKSENNDDTTSKSSESSNLNDSGKGTAPDSLERPKSTSRLSERAKKKSWYSVLYPSYKSRSEDFKKLFKGVPDDERLVVDYSCAVQRDILVHGRLYVSQNYMCFYANIFRWETCLCIKWKDVTAITKEKTARVIPNAILVSTLTEKHFITSFTSRDKAYLMLFRVWQNALMGKPMHPQEMWQWVHNCYGDELGLTSDDEDYIDPNEVREDDSQQMYGNSTSKSADSVSEEQSEPQSDGISSSSKQPRDDHSNNDSIIPGVTITCGGNDLLKPEQKLTHRKIRKRDENTLPTSEQLPTDMSDSSDSENEKNIPFISTAECNSMHEGRQLVHTILPINVDTLLSLLFSKSKFYLDFHNNRKTTNLVQGDWEMNEEGLKTRTVSLTVALTQAVGPKCSHVTESQVMRDCSEPGQLYSIDITSVNSGIPYGDSFYVFFHYCLVRTVDDHTMFSVHAQIKYKKSVWGVVKGFIEKNAWAGLEDFYTALLRALQNEYCIPPAKSKGRRPRRGASLTQRPHEDSPIAKTPPICFTNRQVPLAIKIPKVTSTKYESLFWFVIVLLISLILLNVILYFKLWTLEYNASQTRFPDFTVLKNSPTTQEDWIHLMQHQEALHATEMMKWQKLLHVAIEMLRQTETTLNDLLTMIHTNEHSSHSQNLVPEKLYNKGAFPKELK